MRLCDRSLALLSGLRIGITVSCGVGCRWVLDLALLWLWYRPLAVAPIRPLAWEPPYAVGAALKSEKKEKRLNVEAKAWTSLILSDDDCICAIGITLILSCYGMNVCVHPQILVGSRNPPVWWYLEVEPLGGDACTCGWTETLNVWCWRSLPKDGLYCLYEVGDFIRNSPAEGELWVRMCVCECVCELICSSAFGGKPSRFEVT